MLVNTHNMRACYDFLKSVSFNGLRLPSSRNVTFIAKKLKGYHGFYIYPDHIIVIDTCTPTIERLMQIMAHEMIHAALEQNAEADHGEHDDNFKSLAEIIENEMGWKQGSV